MVSDSNWKYEAYSNIQYYMGNELDYHDEAVEERLENGTPEQWEQLAQGGEADIRRWAECQLDAYGKPGSGYNPDTDEPTGELGWIWAKTKTGKWVNLAWYRTMTDANAEQQRLERLLMERGFREQEDESWVRGDVRIDFGEENVVSVDVHRDSEYSYDVRITSAPLPAIFAIMMAAADSAERFLGKESE